jgi:hypothetical protein
MTDRPRTRLAGCTQLDMPPIVGHKLCTRPVPAYEWCDDISRSLGWSRRDSLHRSMVSLQDRLISWFHGFLKNHVVS